MESLRPTEAHNMQILKYMYYSICTTFAIFNKRSVCTFQTPRSLLQFTCNDDTMTIFYWSLWATLKSGYKNFGPNPWFDHQIIKQISWIIDLSCTLSTSIAIVQRKTGKHDFIGDYTASKKQRPTYELWKNSNVVLEFHVNFWWLNPRMSSLSYKSRTWNMSLL